MGNAATPTLFTLPHQPQYNHTQRGWMHWLIMAPAIIVLPIVAIQSSGEASALALMLVGLAIVVLALGFRTLSVVDEGDALAIRYGPLPLFRKRIRYDEITDAEQDRTTIVDGWGIHWIPGRGWTYNLWGCDCVRLTLISGRTIRIGTDDPGALAAFLKNRCGAKP